VAGYLVAGVLLAVGAGWYSFGAGLVVAGVCAAVLTTLLLVDVGGDE
jgi:uncharacterized membrane protein YbjE (DUF340 family)